MENKRFSRICQEIFFKVYELSVNLRLLTSSFDNNRPKYSVSRLRSLLNFSSLRRNIFFYSIFKIYSKTTCPTPKLLFILLKAYAIISNYDLSSLYDSISHNMAKSSQKCMFMKIKCC